ncbi:MAG: hypothetical protein HY720_12255, partial [Planctomycetes bacterium]|nr:hypothetical protein [Planctomycetota bacterium]
MSAGKLWRGPGSSPQHDDTIVAVSSPPGASLVAVVRSCGPRALEIASGLFEPADGEPVSRIPGSRARAGRFTAGALSFPAVLYVFRAPRSYTGDDLVELHIPGSL